MRMLHRLQLLLVIPSGAAMLAAGPDRPPIWPRQDAAITYQLGGVLADSFPGGVPGPIVVRWDSDSRRLRAEVEGRTQAALLDLDSRQGALLDSRLRTAVPIGLGSAGGILQELERARFTRVGQDRVAGFDCTRWSVQHPRGTGTICLTTLGTPLRGEGQVNGRQGSFMATTVEIAPQSDSFFRQPEGYARIDLNSLVKGLRFN